VSRGGPGIFLYKFVMPKITAYESRAEKLVMELMAIPGRSGEEGGVAKFIIERLAAAGAPAEAIRFDTTHKRSPIGGEIGNLIVRLPGTVKGPRRMLMAHMDTVPVCAGAEPVKRGGRIVSAAETGLGGDDRSGVAVILAAALEILEKKLPHGPLTFLFCVQEEVGLFGARYADVKLLGKPAMAFNFDGGSPASLCVGATGAYRLVIKIKGVPAHAGVHPEQGVSAIAIAALAIADLQKNGWHGLIEKGRSRGTSNVGVIQGGEATNVVTHELSIKAEARSHDKGFRRRIVAEYLKAFEKAARAVKNTAGKRGEIEFETRHDYEAFRLDEKSGAAEAAAAAASGLGLDPVFKVSNGGLDANWMNQHGVPTVTLGAGQHDIHTTEEWLDLKEFYAGARLGLALATGV
jgi:tripeptide aminopeptidase